MFPLYNENTLSSPVFIICHYTFEVTAFLDEMVRTIVARNEYFGQKMPPYLTSGVLSVHTYALDTSKKRMQQELNLVLLLLLTIMSFL